MRTLKKFWKSEKLLEALEGKTFRHSLEGLHLFVKPGSLAKRDSNRPAGWQNSQKSRHACTAISSTQRIIVTKLLVFWNLTRSRIRFPRRLRFSIPENADMGGKPGHSRWAAGIVDLKSMNQRNRVITMPEATHAHSKHVTRHRTSWLELAPKKTSSRWVFVLSFDMNSQMSFIQSEFSVIFPNLESLLFAVKRLRIPRANKQSEKSLERRRLRGCEEENVSSHMVPSQRDRIPIDVDHTVHSNSVRTERRDYATRKRKSTTMLILF